MIANIFHCLLIGYGLTLIFCSIKYLKTKKFPKIFIAIQNILFYFILSVGLTISLYVPYIEPFLVSNNFSTGALSFIKFLNFNELVIFPLYVACISGAIGKSITGYNLIKLGNIFWISLYLFLYNKYNILTNNTQAVLFVVFMCYISSAIISSITKKIIESKHEKSKFDLKETSPKLETRKCE